MSSGGSRALARTIDQLWPDAEVRVGRGMAAAGASAWFVLPSLRRPRLLLPSGEPGAAVMLRRYSGRTWTGPVRSALEAGVRVRALDRLPVARLTVRGGGVHVHIGEVLPEMAAVGVLLGTERANSKPVLQVFDEDGHTIAFVKLDPRPGAPLAGNEARALTSLAEAAPAGLHVPRLMHRGRWNDLEVLVLSPLSGSQALSADDDPVLPAVASIAASAGPASSTVTRLAQRQRAHAVSLARSPEVEAVLRALTLADRSWGDDVLPTGAWHGDWAPWNIRKVGANVQAWDWERFDTDVPYGVDAVHHRAQLLWRDGYPAEECGPLLEAAQQAVQKHSPGPAPAALPVVMWYLVEIALRYLQDQPPGGPARPRTRWVLSQLQCHANVLEAP